MAKVAVVTAGTGRPRSEFAALALSLLIAVGIGAAAPAHADRATSPRHWPLKPTSVAGMPGTPQEAAIPHATSASGAQCRNYYFPVTQSATSSVTYREFGQLCTNDPRKLGQQPIQVLIPGGTYTHIYYDWPYQPDRYNYVKYMTERGYTTLSLDRLGYGYSDHPVAETLNFDVAALNTHQIVQYLRAGALGRRFNTVVTNGYSMGGLTAQVEAATYHDVDALAVHAVGHGLLTPASLLRLGTAVYPAVLDPKFAGRLWAIDPGYETTIPGKRDLFYGPQGTYDSEQLAVEEQTKDTASATELADIALRSYTDQTKQITAPVLWSIGQYDKIWCGTTDDCYTDPMTQQEPDYYQPGLLTASVVPNTGHGVLLGHGGTDYLEDVAHWLAAHDIPGV